MLTDQAYMASLGLMPRSKSIKEHRVVSVGCGSQRQYTNSRTSKRFPCCFLLHTLGTKSLPGGPVVYAGRFEHTLNKLHGITPSITFANHFVLIWQSEDVLLQEEAAEQRPAATTTAPAPAAPDGHRRSITQCGTCTNQWCCTTTPAAASAPAAAGTCPVGPEWVYTVSSHAAVHGM
jgi:hypothetical protein